MPNDATYHRKWRAERYARRRKQARPWDLPEDAECKTCANLPNRRPHVCIATQWLLDEPVCDDCAEGLFHDGRARVGVRVGSRGDIRRRAA